MSQRISTPIAFALGATLSCHGDVRHSTLVTAAPRHAAARSPSPTSTAPVASGIVATLRLIERRAENSPLVTIRIVIEGGSADDPTGKEGLTFVAAKTIAEGGTQDLTYEQVQQRLFPIAARFDVHVDRDMTVFVAQVHRDHASDLYPLVRDLLVHPRLADDDLVRVRRQTLSALTLDLRGNSDETLVREVLQSAIYAEHPYGHPAIGTERGLGALTLADVHAQIDRVFCGRHMLVGIAGGYDPSLAAHLRADLTGLRDETCTPRPALPAVVRPHGVHVVLVDKPSANAVAIAFGAPVAITPASDDYAALSFATDLLGIHRQSAGLLYQTIREARGINYGDYMYASHFEQVSGAPYARTNIQRRQQYASVWVRPVPTPMAMFALRAALRTVQRTLDLGIQPPDVSRWRTYLDGFVGLATQSESSRLGDALDLASDRLTATSFADRWRTQWAALDADAVTTVARRELTTRDVWVAIVAPNAAELTSAFASDAPSPITYDSPKPPDVMAEDRDIAAWPIALGTDAVRVVPLADVFR